MSLKPKSGLSDNATNKAAPATPKVAKTNRGVVVSKSDADSPSPLQNPRLSMDRSPRSVNSKPSADRRSSRISTPPEKPQPRILKPSEFQAQLTAALEDLKKAKEKLALVEKEKTQAVYELKEVTKLADEANEKLQEALVAQKRAEEISEIERFRAIEMEQAGIEVAQKKDEEWQKELETVRNQHALDVAALLSASQELQRVKQELVMTIDTKNQALSHADDATKIAEIHAEKLDILSAELLRLKGLLDSKHELQENDGKLVADMKSELDSLKLELEKAKSFESTLVQKEDSYEQLNVELEASRMAESYARMILEEWKSRVKELEVQVEQANRLERSASESLGSVMKQLEDNSDLLHEAECEIASLKEKLALLEMSVGRQKGDLDESERRLQKANEEAARAARVIESLRSELQIVKEDKIQSLENEKLAASSIQALLEEKNQLINELETIREEEERSKKAMESLASALHEVSAEAREVKEKLLYNHAEQESFEAQIDDLKLVLKATSEKYETMLDEAKREIEHLTVLMDHSKVEFENQIEDLGLALKTANVKYEGMLDDAKGEIDRLTNMMQQIEMEHTTSKAEWERQELQMVSCLKTSEEEKFVLKAASQKHVTKLDEANHEIDHLKSALQSIKEEYERSKAEWEQKELQLVNHIKKSEEEVSSMETEIMKLLNSLKETEEKSHAVAEEESHLKCVLVEARSELTSLKQALQGAQEESVKFRDSLSDRENELQNLMQENQQLRAAVDFNVQKLAELSKLLEEVNSKKQLEENGELSGSEKDYDLLPKVIEFSEGNGYRSDEQPEMEHLSLHTNPETFVVSSERNDGLSEEAIQLGTTKIQDAHGKAKVTGNEEKAEHGAAESETKLWESCKIDETEFSTEKEAEQESLDDELDSKADGSESFDQGNGLPLENEVKTSPSKQPQQKKKKPLYRKFGSLLKKGIGNQK
ncbi:hypothetical protein Dimus_000001 [Dionaea muscipula]